jgi:FdhD protein
VIPNKKATAESEKVEIHRVSDGRKEIVSDVVICETEVLIELNGVNYKSLYCLPAHLEELARGHLISKGICRPSGIKSIEVKRDGDRFVIAATVDEHSQTKSSELNSEVRIGVADIWDAVEKLNEHSILFKKTGGTHVAKIWDGHNSVFAEDVSRHCAIDKVIGFALGSEMNLSASALVTSCRQTESTITKAIYAQIPIVITISAPTSLAIESAQKFGITLIGFARGNRFNIYSHQWRVE